MTIYVIEQCEQEGSIAVRDPRWCIWPHKWILCRWVGIHVGLFTHLKYPICGITNKMDYMWVHGQNPSWNGLYAGAWTYPPCLLEWCHWAAQHIGFGQISFFFKLRSTTQTLTKHAHSHPYTNPTPMSIFEDWAGKSLKLTRSPQTPRCRRERRLPLNAQCR